jgi:hypothetical protein
MTDNRRRMPNDASLTDDRADRSTTSFTPMGPGLGAIVGDLVQRSGNPRGMMMPRYGSTRLCSVCGLSPDQPAQATHEYLPMIDRSPGVSQDVVWNRTQNSQPEVDAPGQAQMAIIGDEELDSGLAEARWNQATSRQRQGQWPR